MGRRLQTVAAVTFMKILLMIFNVIFWLTGVVFLIIGIWMKISLHQFLELSKDYNSAAPYVFIGTGALIMLIGFLACCCTVKGQPILLYMLAGFLVLVFIVELGAAISGYIYRRTLREGFRNGLNSSFHNYGKNNIMDKDVDFLQTKLKCCGIDEYKDWFKIHFSKINNSVPVSCCKNHTSCDHAPVRDVMEIYHEGCYKKVVTLVEDNLAAIGGGAIGLACFQLLGVLLSCCLAKHVNKAKYEQMA